MLFEPRHLLSDYRNSICSEAHTYTKPDFKQKRMFADQKGCPPKGASGLPCRRQDRRSGRETWLESCADPPSVCHSLTPGCTDACAGARVRRVPLEPACMCVSLVCSSACLSIRESVWDLIVSFSILQAPIPSGDISSYESFMMCISCHK